MPNLRGASPVGHGGEGRSYEAQTVGSSESGGRPSRKTRARWLDVGEN